MDLTSLQIEGITRSKFNLDNYDFATKKVAGNRRLIHVSTLREDGKKQYYSYEMKTINKTTVNLRCHQRNQKIGYMKTGEIRADGKEHRAEKLPRAQCSAILTCTVAMEASIRIHSDFGHGAKIFKRTISRILLPTRPNPVMPA